MTPSAPAPRSPSVGWREVPPLRPVPAPAPTASGAPLTVRQAAVVPDLGGDVWRAAVEAAERAFGRPGVSAGEGDHRRWTAGPSHGRRRQARVVSVGVAGGVRVEVEAIRPRPRPWSTAVTLVCVPVSVVVASVLAGRTASLNEWAAAAGLAAVPAVVAVWAAAVEWSRSLADLGRVRRVLAAVERASWRAQAVWVEAHEVSEDPDGPGHEIDPPFDLGPAEWLALDEMDGLLDARPARPAPTGLRRARRTVERATADPRPPPEGFSEWRPDARTVRSG